MDELERNRLDVGTNEDPPGGQADDPFARWSAARARVRDAGALRELEGAQIEAAVGVADSVARLRGEIASERELRIAAERKAHELAAALEHERNQRATAEQRADSAFAELELHTHASRGMTPKRRRKQRVKRALRRISPS